MKKLIASIFVAGLVLSSSGAGVSMQDVSNIVNSMMFGNTNNYAGLVSNIAQIQTNVETLSNTTFNLQKENSTGLYQHFNLGAGFALSLDFVSNGTNNFGLTNYPYYLQNSFYIRTNSSSPTNVNALFWNIPINLESSNNSYIGFQDEALGFGVIKKLSISNGVVVVR